MGFRIHYRDRNVAEEGHRLYRDTQPIDTQDPPVPLVTLGPDVEMYDDATPVADQTYHMVVGAYTGGDTVEKFSDPIQVDAVELSTPLLCPEVQYSFNYRDEDRIYPDDGEMIGEVHGTVEEDNSGPWGPAIRLTDDSYTGYVQIGGAGAFPVIGPFSIAFGVKFSQYHSITSSRGGNYPLVARSQGSSNATQTDFCCDVWGTNTNPYLLRFFFYGTDGSSNLVSTPNLPTVGQWTSVVCVYDGLNLLIYLDKELKATEPVPPTARPKFSEQNSLLRLGSRRSTNASDRRTEHFMTRVRLFDYGLTAQDVSDLVDELNGEL